MRTLQPDHIEAFSAEDQLFDGCTCKTCHAVVALRANIPRPTMPAGANPAYAPCLCSPSTPPSTLQTLRMSQAGAELLRQWPGGRGIRDARRAGGRRMPRVPALGAWRQFLRAWHCRSPGGVQGLCTVVPNSWRPRQSTPPPHLPRDHQKGRDLRSGPRGGWTAVGGGCQSGWVRLLSVTKCH